MTRERLPDRRLSCTLRVEHAMAGGQVLHLLVTVGYDAEDRPREVFCANFKTGGDMLAVVTDACILVSRLLQMGVPPAELVTSMCEPSSLVGTVVRAVAREAIQEVAGE